MKDFLEHIAKQFHWVVFLLLETLSGFMLFRFNQFQGSVWYTQANALTGTVLEWEAELLSYLHLKEENLSLVQENSLLQHNIHTLKQELARYRHDSTYTEKSVASVLQGYKLIPAQIISGTIHKQDNFFLLNVGSEDGVQEEMGVVGGTGVVGIVCKTDKNYALVISILNSKSNISCRLRESEYYGYLKWNGGSPIKAYVDDIPRHARFKEGDVVETSGFSHAFPPGIFIGRIAKIKNSQDGLAFQPDVQLGIDLANTTNVSVIVPEDRAQMDSITQTIHKKK